MDDLTKELFHRFDKMSDKIGDLATNQAVMTENLKEHMRRTEQNEKLIEAVQSELKPIQRHVTMLEGALKLLGVASFVVGFIAGCVKVAAFVHQFFQ